MTSFAPLKGSPLVERSSEGMRGLDAAIVLTAAILVGLALLVMRVWPPLNGDAAAILSFADRMLDGEQLYTDLIDVNPPVIFWLSMVPASVARVTGWSITATTSAWTGILILLSAGLSAAMWRRQGQCEPLVIAAIAAVVVLPSHNHSQREHILIILALPWLLLAVLRQQGEPCSTALAMTAGVVAGIGLSIKPYYLVPALLVEGGVLVVLGPRRWLARPELWGLAVAGSVVALGLATIARPWLSEIVPLVARHYADLGWETAWMVLSEEERPQLLAALLLLMLVARARPAALFGLGALAGAMLQGKGWDYHLLPAWAALLLALGLALDQWGGRLALALAGLLFGVTLVLTTPLVAEGRHSHSLERRMTDLLRRDAGPGPVLWLTASIWPHFPAVLDARVRLSGPYMNLWLVQALYRSVPFEADGRPRYRSDAEASDDERAVRRHLRTALLRTPPTLILVAPAAEEVGFAGQSFDYLDWLATDPDLAPLLARYRLRETVAGIRVLARAAE
ncbi:MAG: hypothetical protein SF002_09280 [Alphaproteobacteria bacterium]|nr:hypothetical protein [Alphaproteobacteria bacterium]